MPVSATPTRTPDLHRSFLVGHRGVRPYARLIEERVQRRGDLYLERRVREGEALYRRPAAAQTRDSRDDRLVPVRLGGRAWGEAHERRERSRGPLGHEHGARVVAEDAKERGAVRMAGGADIPRRGARVRQGDRVLLASGRHHGQGSAKHPGDRDYCLSAAVEVWFRRLDEAVASEHVGRVFEAELPVEVLHARGGVENEADLPSRPLEAVA